MTFAPDTILARSSTPLSIEMDGEMVMMDVESGTYFNLDPIGTVIWKRLESPVRFDDLCRELQARYDAAPETIRADVAALLEQMRAHGLLGTAAS